MKRNWNRLLGLGLTLTLTASLLAGCGDGDEPTPTEEPKPAPTQMVAPAETTEPTETPEVEPTEDPEEESGWGRFHGWWVHPEGYESEGLSLVDIFYLDAVAGTWEPYNEFGEPGNLMDCSVEGDTLILDLELWDAPFLYEDGALLDPDTLEVEFIQVDAPDFNERATYDGVYYLDGDVDSGKRVELSGNQFTIYVDDSVSEQGTWEESNAIYHTYSGWTFPGVCRLSSTESFGPEFILEENDGVLYCEDFFEYECYVREDLLDEVEAQIAQRKALLMSQEWDTEAPVDGEHAFYRLTLRPYGFEIAGFTGIEGGGVSQDTEFQGWAGVWSLTQDNELVLTYIEDCDAYKDIEFADTEPDILDAEDGLEEIYLPTVGETFYLN